MASSHTSFLHLLRQYELERALSFFPRHHTSTMPLRVLEIGAGTGYQARYLADQGYAVTALDVQSSAYREERVFPIAEYDGRTIPAADASFEVVFSSNVLEHVHEIDSILEELRRVMTPDGCAIHILPTPAWRFWTIFTHYLWLAKRFFAILLRFGNEKDKETQCPRIPTTWHGLFATLFPLRHGERGITLTEMYFYRQRWWKKKFEAHGYYVVKILPAGIFYSSFTLGPWLSISNRERLACALGSACRIYVFRKKQS